MNFKLLLFVILIEIVRAKLCVNVSVDRDKNISLSHSGIEVNIITNEDIKAFKVSEKKLLETLKRHLGKRPSNVFFKSPTPWGDLYKTYMWEQVKKILTIKSIRVKNLTMKPVIVLSQDFENTSNHSIKVNTGISQTVENTMSTVWSKQKEITVSQEIDYDVNVVFAKLAGSTSFSYTNTWGFSEEKITTETIGANTGMEMELKPGESVTAMLSASTGQLEIEVVYKASLRGNLAVNYRRAYSGHHFWGPTIQDVMETGGIANEITEVETIKLGCHVDATLKVYDKKTGLPL